MKIKKLLAVTLVVCSGVLCGCAKNYKEGTRTAAGIQNVGQEALAGKSLVETTVAALDDLFNNEQGNIKDQFKTYSKAVNNLESQSRKVRKRVETMASRKADYLKQWDAQMTQIDSVAIRQTAEQRRIHVEEMFSKVHNELDVAAKSFRPFMSKLNDIKTALNMDLNRNGLNALKPVANQAKVDARIVTTHLDKVISTLDETAQALTGNGS